MCTMFIKIITQVIVAFWLVLACDLLEDRRTTDVIITKFFPLCFKIGENFENQDTAETLNRFEKQEEER